MKQLWNQKLLIMLTVTVMINPLLLSKSIAGPGRSGLRMYEPASEIKVHGVIQDIVYRPSKYRPGTGMHLRLLVNGKEWFVHLGPKAFFEESEMQLAVGDKALVTGAVSQQNGKQFLIAREIQKQGQALIIRDEMGRSHFRRR
ncbi:hypothetical protein [Pseudobacteriovorax antillogorgiicola]|uniref:Magnetosome protein MamS/MamX domain-containing protein n=1 Tax=Pseudobacteriovorax antillogorgiicola TaxID=1513793 RepID=A0A1Y6BKB1_9BACT|nr:hypothetical protein [Pseudobacteriovorax antillogorgiicola]TCS55444.1 hypothetical protein EDD56_105165 [Pseudobacteriovorax antillogorgiicola]SMF12385.1 hypothetical protein SAMN06296036_105159 [Pseudobacteriovorax antillogorgiicola]